MDEILLDGLKELAARCPGLLRHCYWAGTAAIAIEELGHRQSFDLDLHTRSALFDVRPLLAEIERAFPGRFEVLDPPDELGSGFSGVLRLAGGQALLVQVFSNYEDVQDDSLVPARAAAGLYRVTLARYLADKLQCVVERTEARDLADIEAVLRSGRVAEGGLERRVRQHRTGGRMKRTYCYVQSRGTVCCTLPDGESVELPLFPGILRHLTLDQLRERLQRPAVARKYTRQALAIAPWQVLREFPRAWLLRRIEEEQASLRPARLRALWHVFGRASSAE